MKGTGCKGRNRSVGKVDDGGLLKLGDDAVQFHAKNALRSARGDGLTLQQIEKAVVDATGKKPRSAVLVKILHEWDKHGSITTFTRGGKIRLRWSR